MSSALRKPSEPSVVPSSNVQKHFSVYHLRDGTQRCGICMRLEGRAAQSVRGYSIHHVLRCDSIEHKYNIAGVQFCVSPEVDTPVEDEALGDAQVS